MKIKDLFEAPLPVMESLAVRYRKLIDSIRGSSLYHITGLNSAANIVRSDVMLGRFSNDAKFEPKASMIPYRGFTSFSTQRDNDYTRSTVISSFGSDIHVLFELDKKKTVRGF